MVNKYRDELELGLTLAREVGTIIMNGYFNGFEVQIKDDGTPVTSVDVASNERIVERLQSVFPGDGIVSEELDDILSNTLGTRVWYVDPLDGTRSFTHHADHFAVHLGLVVDRKPVLGIVYKPTTDESYFAVKGGGAYLRSPSGLERQLEVNRTGDISALRVIAKSDCLRDDPIRSVLEKMKPKSVMTMGSEGLRMMKIAEGYADIHFPNNATSCCTWDLCAPQIIVEEAGGYVAFHDGSSILYDGQRKLGKFFVAAGSEEVMQYGIERLNERIGYNSKKQEK